MWEKVADVLIIISGVFCSVVGTYRKEGRKVGFIFIFGTVKQIFRTFSITHQCRYLKRSRKQRTQAFSMDEEVKTIQLFLYSRNCRWPL